MRIHYAFFLTIFSCSSFICAAQFCSSVGARAGALGSASVTFTDVWSAFNNQAGLAHLKTFNVGVNYENRFLLPELSLKSFAAAIPFKGTTFALSASSFGYHLYSENKYGLALAKAFGENISAGVQFDYLKTQIAEGYGTKGVATVEIGVLAKPVKNLIIAAHLFNPVRSKLNNYNNERVPTIMKLGASYSFSEKVVLITELNKITVEQVQFKVGLEYVLIKDLYIRAGMNTTTPNIALGFGITLKQFKIDISSSYHQVLGYTPQLAIVYAGNHE